MDTYAPVAYQPTHSIWNSVAGALKLISFIGTAFIAAYLIASSISLDLTSIFKKPEVDPTVITSIPLKYTFFSDVGNVVTPHIETTVESTSGKAVPITFLVDSGAKISALPVEYISSLGIDTATAKRIYLRSATNTTTYGYLTDITMNMNGTKITVPIAFAEIIEPLLGTFGFFDNYTILFENGQQLVIKTKV